MTNNPPLHRYRTTGIAKGVPARVIDRAIAQRVSHDDRSVPVLSLMHLANITHSKYDFLRQIVSREIDPYHDLCLTNSVGKVRSISSPQVRLLQVQRFILAQVLNSVKLSPRSYAYTPGKSSVQCAREHIGAKWIVKFDLHDFFPSVDEVCTYKVFLECGYNPLVSFELSRICTRVDGRCKRHELSSGRTEKPYVIEDYSGKYPLGCLPQGAPTSGVIANAALYELDLDLERTARGDGLIYTRYSDDLTFSAGPEFSRKGAESLIATVAKLVASAGFELHRKKTRVAPPGGRHVVLGLRIGEDSVWLPRRFKRDIEVKIHSVSRYGLVEVAKRRGFDSHISFVAHVNGAISYAFAVEPSWARDREIAWRSALWRDGFPL